MHAPLALTKLQGGMHAALALTKLQSSYKMCSGSMILCMLLECWWEDQAFLCVLLDRWPHTGAGKPVWEIGMGEEQNRGREVEQMGRVAVRGSGPSGSGIYQWWKPDPIPCMAASMPPFSPYTCTSEITSTDLKRPTAERGIYEGVRGFKFPFSSKALCSPPPLDTACAFLAWLPQWGDGERIELVRKKQYETSALGSKEIQRGNCLKIPI